MKKRTGGRSQELSWFVPLAILLVLAILIVTVVLLRSAEERRPQPPLPAAPVSPRSERSAPDTPHDTARAAIIIDDIGWSRSLAEEVVRLEEPLTAAVLPLGETSEAIARTLAASSNLEVILHMPMEPLPPARPFGSYCLLTRMTPEEIARTFEQASAPYAGVIKGVNNHMGSAFTMDAQAMRAFLAELKKRGLYFVDSMTSSRSCGYALAKEMGIPAARRRIFLDNSSRPEDIAAQMQEFARIALREKRAIAICHCRQATIGVLREELPRLRAEGVELVPVCALLE